MRCLAAGPRPRDALLSRPSLAPPCCVAQAPRRPPTPSGRTPISETPSPRTGLPPRAPTSCLLRPRSMTFLARAMLTLESSSQSEQASQQPRSSSQPKREDEVDSFWLCLQDVEEEFKMDHLLY